VTTTLFRVPQCKDFGEASFHEDDYSIDCTTTKFMLIKALAFFVILLIPIGVPAVFAFLMVRAKRSLGGVVNETATGGAKLSADDVDEESDAYAFLTDDYRPEYYFYEIVTYSKKLVLGGVAVMVGRGTMAQTYFVIAAEAFYLMHHMRTFPFVNYKHNVIEALGHQALMLMYAIVLIIRNDSESTWREEWFPREGYGWFICFLSVVVLPSPTVYYYYKETHSATGTRWTSASSTAAGADDNFQENPLSMDSGPSDAYDIEGRELPNAPPAQVKLAKMQREAKETRAQNQKMQTQLLPLQTDAITKDAEIASLKAMNSAKDESTKVQALQAQNATKDNTIAALKAQLAQAPQPSGAQLQLALSDASPGTNAPPQLTKTQQATIKEFAADESLSEETREAAKQALDEIAAAQIMAQVRQSKILDKKMVLPGEEMAKYLESLRLLHSADAVIRVVGTCVD
jgi:hypothetical protein